MGVLMQIRDVPEEVHRTVKARAALRGVSLSEYVRDLLTRDASRPTPEELEAQIDALGRVRLEEPPEVTVRHVRDSYG